MNYSYELCRWPEIEDKYLSALKEIVTFLFTNYQTIVGIVASGTIIRGNPGPSSDLDICVIHLDNFRQRIQKYFCGVPTEIFINPPKRIDQYFIEEQSDYRPVTAHMLSTGFVVFKSDPIVDQIINKANQTLAQKPEVPNNLEIRRYMIACTFEDAIDIKDVDPENAKLLLNRAIDQIVCLVYMKNGQNIPRTKQLLSGLSKIDDKTLKLAKEYYKNRSFKRQIEIANEIAETVIEATGFFEWKMEPEVLK